MNKFKKLFAWVTCLCLITSVVQAGHAYFDGINWTWGTLSDTFESIIAPGTTYRSINASSPIGPQRIHSIEFDPKNPHMKLRAGLSHGCVNGVQTVTGMANDMNKKHPGQVVAAINGDFFDLGVGVPFGIFIDEGEILSTPPQYSNAFGIKKDGTPFVMSHGSILDQILVIGDKKFPLTGINNRHKDADGLMLYTDKFGTSTRAKKDSVEVMCSVVSGEARHGQTMVLKVNSTRHNIGDAPIGKGQVVLSAIGLRKNDLAYLQAGYDVSITLKFNQFWSDVEFAVAGNRVLLKDGVATNQSSTVRAPRTVIGCKPDGKVVFYTIDGRHSSYSVGATYQQAATIMRDLGCVDALNLDGGGSTTFVMRPLAEMRHKRINRPSEGSERQVANSVILLNTAPYGEAANLIIRTSGRKVLSGGTYSYSVGAVDVNLQPKTPTGAYVWGVDPSFGSISPDGKFHAQGSGFAQISVTNGVISGVTTTEVVTNITQIQSEIQQLSINANTAHNISVSVLRNGKSIEFTKDALQWSVEGAIGSFSAPGRFVAGKIAASGNIIISYGNIGLKIPVTVSGPSPEALEKFKDLREHVWAKEAIYRLVNAGVIRGVTVSTFMPAKPITRADFMLMLVRMMKIDLSGEPTDNFTDVPKESYYYKELGAVKELGIAQGTGANTFEPLRNITRQEMFTLTLRVLKQFNHISEDASLDRADVYTDSASIADYACQAIATLSENDLVQGDEKGRVNPQKSATRAESAVFMDRVYTFIQKNSQKEG